MNKKIPPEVKRPPIEIVKSGEPPFEPVFFIIGVLLLVLFILVSIK